MNKKNFERFASKISDLNSNPTLEQFIKKFHNACIMLRLSAPKFIQREGIFESRAHVEVSQ